MAGPRGAIIQLYDISQAENLHRDADTPQVIVFSSRELVGMCGCPGSSSPGASAAAHVAAPEAGNRGRPSQAVSHDWAHHWDALHCLRQHRIRKRLPKRAGDLYARATMAIRR